MRHFLCIIVLFLVINRTFAQQPVYTNYRWFKVEDGLPQGFISSMVKDADGFIWIGTRDGLARYDGRSFRIFRHIAHDSNSLSSNVILRLFRDSHNMIWVTYVNESMDRFDPRSFKAKKLTSLNPSLSFPQAGTLIYSYEKNDEYWSYKGGKGVYAMNIKTGQVRHFSKADNNLKGSWILGLAGDSSGRVWINTPEGLEVSDEKRKYFTQIPFPKAVNESQKQEGVISADSSLLLCMQDGRIIVAENDKLLVLDKDRHQFSIFPFGMAESGNSSSIKTILKGPDGLIYIEKGGCIYRWERNGQFTYLWNYPSKDLHYAQSILIDASNVLWFGTNASGLLKVDFASLPVTAFSYTHKFHVEALSRFPGVMISKIPKDLSDDQPSYNFRYKYTPDGGLLLSNYLENRQQNTPVYYFKDGIFVSLLMPPRPFYSMSAINMDRQGRIFAISLNNEIYKWENLKSYPVISRIRTQIDRIVDVETDDNGDLWISSSRFGLYQIRNNSIYKQFTQGQKTGDLPSVQLTDLLTDMDDDSLLWIGTLGDGLVLFNKKTGVKRVFTDKEGLPNNTIYALVPDEQGNIWMSTNNGICCLNRKTYFTRNFNVADGLPENEFNRFHAFKYPDGKILMGGSNGFAIFDPALLKEDSFAPIVNLTSLSVNNAVTEFGDASGILKEPLSTISRLELPYNKNFVSVEFAALQFNQPGKIRYRYMLRGYDNNWIESRDRNIASYTKLPAGRYTLLLNASNTSGKWSPYIRSLRIHVKPPYWATWWAYTIYALVIVILVQVYWRYRINRIHLEKEILFEQSKAKHLQELDEIKNRFFDNITHEFRTPLTLILTPLEKLSRDNSLSRSHQNVLENAYRNAGQLLRLINQLLDISRIESGHMEVHLTIGELDEFIQSCISQFSLQAKEKNIQISISDSGVSGHYRFDEEKLEKIIFNLVSNAIKFTPEGGQVSVSVQYKDRNNPSAIEIVVSDSGVGISEEKLPKIFDRFYIVDDSGTRSFSGTGIGLSLVKELVLLMKGIIEVKSEPGKGSSFIISLPLERMDTASEPKYHSGSVLPYAGTAKMGTSLGNITEGPLVLVVEDNDELRSFIAESLSAHWRVIEASNGKSAWQAILNELPDIVISDVMMPEMDGVELCRMAKNDDRTAHIGFILLTARTAHKSKLKGLGAGADEYITKPFHFDELELRLRNLVKQQEYLQKHLQNVALPQQPLPKLPHINDIFLQKLYKELDERIDEPDMDVENLARAMNMSRRTLNRKLNSLLKISPNELIKRYRLQKAATLLASGLGVSQTAYTVGFETPSYFTQCFKEQYGQTPSDFASPKTA